MTSRPMPGAQAPDLSLPLVGGGTFTLSEQSPGLATMIVFYRGYHCPVCKGYLGKLESLAADFDGKGMPVVAVSMDGEERATKAREEWGLSIPVAYGLSETGARNWGLYISKAIKEVEADVFCEPGTFWVLPDNSLYLIDIASMPFARPDLELLLDKAPMIDKGYPARGTRAG